MGCRLQANAGEGNDRTDYGFYMSVLHSGTSYFSEGSENEMTPLNNTIIDKEANKQMSNMFC
jgi:hypothetical protein